MSYLTTILNKNILTCNRLVILQVLLLVVVTLVMASVLIITVILVMIETNNYFILFLSGMPPVMFLVQKPT